ncbi:MAG: 50S ribosomal protein L10 [Parcubacteria group bacterium]|nr:50S ribosomal protein L10 [Parcubacteria group bacterium]
MAVTREKKETVVKALGDIVRNAGSVVFVHFKGLTVANANEMRQSLREKGVGYTVTKKTLLRRALSDAGVTGTEPALEGEIALAYSSDAMAAAKNIAAFQKKLEDAVMPVGGIFEARYITGDEVKNLALIPSREELYGQFVRVLSAPMRGAVTVLNGPLRSLVGALDQIARSRV